MATLYDIYPIKFGREDFSSSYSIDWVTKECVSASGQIRTCSHQLNPKITFYLNYNAMTTQELKNLIGFYNACRGSSTPFYYSDFYLSPITNMNLSFAQGKRVLTIDIGGTRYPCPYATHLDDVMINNQLYKPTPALQISNETAFFQIPGDNADNLVTANYISYFRVRFKGFKNKEVTKDRFNASVTLETVW